jgi:hypothetical protein
VSEADRKESLVTYLRKFLTVFVFAAAAALGVAAQDCKRHAEPSGPFSFCFPDGWTAEVHKNEPFKMLFAPRGVQFTANINVRADANQTALPTYVGSYIRMIISNPSRVGANSVKLVSWGDFVSDSQVKGERLGFETEYKGLLIRTVQYFFEDGPNRKVIVTATGLLSEKDRYDPVFERVGKSFRLDR